MRIGVVVAMEGAPPVLHVHRDRRGAGIHRHGVAGAVAAARCRARSSSATSSRSSVGLGFAVVVGFGFTVVVGFGVVGAAVGAVAATRRSPAAGSVRPSRRARSPGPERSCSRPSSRPAVERRPLRSSILTPRLRPSLFPPARREEHHRESGDCHEHRSGDATPLGGSDLQSSTFPRGPERAANLVQREDRSRCRTRGQGHRVRRRCPAARRSRRRRAGRTRARWACRGAARARGRARRSRPAAGRAGTSAAAARTLGRLLNDTMPLNDRYAPRSSARRASSGPPVKQWKIVRAGTPSLARTPNVSSHASREWITSGEVALVRRARSAPRTRLPARRAASARSGGRARTRRSRRRSRLAEQRHDACRRRCFASCGCSPTVAYTSSCAAARSIAMRRRRESVPTHTIRSTPAARAAAIARRAARRPLVVQVAVAVDPAARHDGRPDVAREQRRALLDREPARAAAPRRRRRAAAGRRPTRQPEPAPHSAAACRDRRRREQRDDAQRLEASPSTPSTVGTGLRPSTARSSMYAFVARIRSQTAPSASDGCTRSHAAAACRRTPARPRRASGPSGAAPDRRRRSSLPPC